MTLPLAYQPESGYKYQIFAKHIQDRIWESCDYAVDRIEKRYLIHEYRIAYGKDYQFKSVLLPKRFWHEEKNQVKL